MVTWERHGHQGQPSCRARGTGTRARMRDADELDGSRQTVSHQHLNQLMRELTAAQPGDPAFGDAVDTVA